MAPVVSVLMAAYNAETYLPNAIESVLSQDMGDLELVIGDNASTDATPEIVHTYAKKDRRVKYFRNARNLGATANWNLCYRYSNPESAYWALLASDDWWDAVYLKNLVKIARDYPSATFVHCDMYRTEADGRIINRYSELFRQFRSTGPHQALRELFGGCYINIMAAIVNRPMQQNILSVHDILDPVLSFTPDYNLWLQLLCRGATAFYVPEPWAYYRKHEGAMTMPGNAVHRLLEEVIIFRDKLAEVCPPDLQGVRREALQLRLARLGFELLSDGQADKAVSHLRAATALRPHRRLDLRVGTAISSLPISSTHRATLWKLALATSRTLDRYRVGG